MASLNCERPPLCRMIDWSFPLTFIVRGDGYPCAGGEWPPLSVSIVNMGLWGCTHLWGQANGYLGNPLEIQHRGVFCAPTIVPATFR